MLNEVLSQNPTETYLVEGQNGDRVSHQFPPYYYRSGDCLWAVFHSRAAGSRGRRQSES